MKLALIHALQCCLIQLCMSVYSTTALMMISKYMTALTIGLVTVLKLESTSIAITIVYQIRYSSRTVIHSL